MDNDLVITKGEDKTGWFVLNKNYPVKRLMTKCCFTVMLHVNAIVRQCSLAVYLSLGSTDMVMPESAFRFGTADLSKEQLETIEAQKSETDFMFPAVKGFFDQVEQGQFAVNTKV